jgi:tryptophanyl-tRNA synthetase
MYTDPNHLRVEDPGQVKGNVVFTYLDAFDPDQDELAELKAHYQRGGLGDGQVKKRLTEILEALIAPIRARRAELAKDPGYVKDVARRGTEVARARTDATKQEVVEGLGIFQGF